MGEARRRREAWVRALQEATGVDRELAEHMHDRHLEPQRLVQRLRAEGADDVDIAFVDVGASADGYEVRCARCGRTARMSTPLPAGKVAVCPDCARGMR